MPDISLCKNNDCPSKGTCYRYTAKASEYQQSYMAPKLSPREKKCDYFLPLKKK